MAVIYPNCVKTYEEAIQMGSIDQQSGFPLQERQGLLGGGLSGGMAEQAFRQAQQQGLAQQQSTSPYIPNQLSGLFNGVHMPLLDGDECFDPFQSEYSKCGRCKRMPFRSRLDLCFFHGLRKEFYEWINN